jgi:hypothetical protein
MMRMEDMIGKEAVDETGKEAVVISNGSVGSLWGLGGLARQMGEKEELEYSY